jgi:hypothetical protein
MQENEFEKKLQQKMELLQVQPNEEVWQKVQAQVAKSNDRKKRFAFFVLLCSLLTTGLLFTGTLKLFDKEPVPTAFSKEQSSHLPAAGTAIKEKRSAGSRQDQEYLSADQTTTTAETSDSELSHQQPSATNGIIGPTTVSAKTTAVQPLSAKSTSVAVTGSVYKPAANRKKLKAVTKARITPALTGEADNIADVVALTQPDPSISETTGSEIRQPGIATPQSEEAVLAPLTTNMEAAAAKKILPEDAANQQENPAIKNVNKVQQKPWSLALSFSGGLSATGNGYSKTGLTADFNEGTTNTPGPSGNPGTIYLPSSAKPGMAFTAGLQASRTLSLKSRLHAGLQYRLHSTSISTGTEFFSGGTREQTFASGNSSVYKNYYHFISLPVSFSTKLLAVGQRDISLEAGVSVSRMIHSNALGFDAGSGIYSSGVTDFNKTFFGITGAVNINLFPKSKTAFYIGPEFFYSLNAASATGMYAGAKHRFFGIRLQKTITK